MASLDRYGNLLNLCVRELQTCAKYVQEHSENKTADFDVIRNIAKEYCETDIAYKNSKQAQEATDKHFDNPENDCTQDVQKIYEKYLSEIPNSTSAVLNHEIWRSISDINVEKKSHPEEQEQDIEQDEVDVDSDDDNQSISEGIILSQFNPPVDPITKKMIIDPCRNRKCRHVYEFSTIMDFLKGFKDRKAKPRCPHIGCSNVKMLSSYISKDNVLKEQIQNFLAESSESLEGAFMSPQSMDVTLE